MKRICAEMKMRLDELICDWEARALQEPWLRLPHEDRIDSLPKVVLGMLEASLGNPIDESAHRFHVHAAAEHGANRRRQGLPEEAIAREYQLLRLTLATTLERAFGTSDKVSEALMRLDLLLRTAREASLVGYREPDASRSTRRNADLERIALSSPFLGRNWLAE